MKCGNSDGNQLLHNGPPVKLLKITTRQSLVNPFFNPHFGSAKLDLDTHVPVSLLCNSAITLLLIPLPAIGCQTFRVKPSTLWALRISLFQLVQLVGNVMNRGRKKILPCQPAAVEMAAPSCIFLLGNCIVVFCPSFGLHPPVVVQ